MLVNALQIKLLHNANVDELHINTFPMFHFVT
jgi:hypothetical protein